MWISSLKRLTTLQLLKNLVHQWKPTENSFRYSEYTLRLNGPSAESMLLQIWNTRVAIFYNDKFKKRLYLFYLVYRGRYFHRLKWGWIPIRVPGQGKQKAVLPIDIVISRFTIGYRTFQNTRYLFFILLINCKLWASNLSIYVINMCNTYGRICNLLSLFFYCLWDFESFVTMSVPYFHILTYFFYLNYI